LANKISEQQLKTNLFATESLKRLINIISICDFLALIQKIQTAPNLPAAEELTTLSNCVNSKVHAILDFCHPRQEKLPVLKEKKHQLKEASQSLNHQPPRPNSPCLYERRQSIENIFAVVLESDLLTESQKITKINNENEQAEVLNLIHSLEFYSPVREGKENGILHKLYLQKQTVIDDELTRLKKILTACSAKKIRSFNLESYKNNITMNYAEKIKKIIDILINQREREREQKFSLDKPGTIPPELRAVLHSLKNDITGKIAGYLQEKKIFPTPNSEIFKAVVEITKIVANIHDNIELCFLNSQIEAKNQLISQLQGTSYSSEIEKLVTELKTLEEEIISSFAHKDDQIQTKTSLITKQEIKLAELEEIITELKSKLSVANKVTETAERTEKAAEIQFATTATDLETKITELEAVRTKLHEDLRAEKVKNSGLENDLEDLRIIHEREIESHKRSYETKENNLQIEIIRKQTLIDGLMEGYGETEALLSEQVIDLENIVREKNTQIENLQELLTSLQGTNSFSGRNSVAS
jgi:hypothetical protein